MIKIIGYILVVASCTLAGFYFSNLEDYRIEDLHEFKKGLDILKSEIRFASMPLPDAALNAAGRLRVPVGAIFERFAGLLNEKNTTAAYEAWSVALEERSGAVYFKIEDIECFKSFGKTLGYLDKSMQLSSIELTVDYIDEKIEQLNESSARSRKMYRSLGLLGGLLIVVIFIGR